MIKINRPDCPNPEALRKNYKHPQNKDCLTRASHGKCMYCESKITHVYFGDVEHIRPKDSGLYPHLEFEWSNLGFVCAQCNNAKRNQYDENTPFINPYEEEPGHFLFAFGSALFHKNGSERAALTIIQLDLNRAELVERRAIRLQEIQKAIDATFRTNNINLQKSLMDELSKEKDPAREYSMFCAALLAAHGH